jgi:maltooligosyltrehalose synthase
MRGNARLPLGEAWGNESLLLPDHQGTSFTDAFTGEHRTVSPEGKLRLSELFEKFPVAMLTSANQQP